MKKGEEDYFPLQYHQAGLMARSWTVETTNEDITQEQTRYQNEDTSIPLNWKEKSLPCDRFSEQLQKT